MRRFWLMALLMVGTMSGPQRGTVAYLSSTGASTADVFTAGKVELENGGTALTTFSVTDLVPGAKSYERLQLHNTGTVSSHYQVASSIPAGDSNNKQYGSQSDTGASSLGNALVAGIKASASGTDTCTNSTDYGTFGGGGALYSSSLTSANGAEQTLVDFSSSRTVAPGSSVYLCVQLALPSTAITTLQNTSASVTLTFRARQASGL